MIYTVTFNPAIDYVIHTDEIRTGAVNRTDSETYFIGGKGINVSFVLAELGVKSVALGFVAGFTGDAIEKGVREKGIKADFIKLGETHKLFFKLDHFVGCRFGLFLFSTKETGGTAEFSGFRYYTEV